MSSPRPPGVRGPGSYALPGIGSRLHGCLRVRRLVAGEHLLTQDLGSGEMAEPGGHRTGCAGDIAAPERAVGPDLDRRDAAEGSEVHRPGLGGEVAGPAGPVRGRRPASGVRGAQDPAARSRSAGLRAGETASHTSRSSGRVPRPITTPRCRVPRGSDRDAALALQRCRGVGGVEAVVRVSLNRSMGSSRELVTEAPRAASKRLIRSQIRPCRPGERGRRAAGRLP